MYVWVGWCAHTLLHNSENTELKGRQCAASLLVHFLGGVAVLCPRATEQIDKWKT